MSFMVLLMIVMRQLFLPDSSRKRTSLFRLNVDGGIMIEQKCCNVFVIKLCGIMQWSHPKSVDTVQFLQLFFFNYLSHSLCIAKANSPVQRKTSILLNFASAEFQCIFKCPFPSAVLFDECTWSSISQERGFFLPLCIHWATKGDLQAMRNFWYWTLPPRNASNLCIQLEEHHSKNRGRITTLTPVMAWYFLFKGHSWCCMKVARLLWAKIMHSIHLN